jgi:hypothetical protein
VKKLDLWQFSGPQEFQEFLSTLLHAEYRGFRSLDVWSPDRGVDDYIDNYETIFQFKYPVRQRLDKRSVLNSLEIGECSILVGISLHLEQDGGILNCVGKRHRRPPHAEG